MLFLETTLKRLRHLKWKCLSKLRYLMVRFPSGHIMPIGNESFKIKKTAFGADGSALWLKVDHVIAPFVNRYGYWDIETSNQLSN